MRKKNDSEDNMSDELLLKYIILAQNKDQYAYKVLIEYFEKDIKGMKARSRLWVPGLEDDDLYQECKVMVAKAIDNFDPTRTRSETNSILDVFRHLIFKMCKARIITLIQESGRIKKKTLNKTESLDSFFEDGDGNEHSLYDKLSSKTPSVSDSLASKQCAELLTEKVNSYLTDLEKKVFALIMESYSYSEVAEILTVENDEVDEKSVDNALQRVKKKLRANRTSILLSIGYDFKTERKGAKNGAKYRS